jgi:chloride channel 2
MAANVSIVSVDDEEMDSDKQYDLQRTIMFGQYSRLADFARSYGEGLRKRTESDVSGSSSAVRMPRSRLNRGKRTMWKYIMRVVNVSKHVVLPNIAEWLYLIVLAVLMAILSYLLDLLIEQFGAAHQKFYKLVTNGFASYLLWVLFSIVFVLFSVGICQIISVNALGSGIPEMKTILRGIELQNYLQFRTLIAKIAGLATVVGSGLPVGKEGPFVHMSSILAHQMGKLITRFNKSIYNEGHNYELLAAACALGVSSNFAAPIGGVLFSIEVTSTYFAVRNYWRGFFAAVIGAFLFRLFAYWFTAEATITALFKTSFAIEIPFNVYEIPVFAMIGVLCGLLAALFVYFHRKCVMWLRKYRKKIKILDKSVFIYPTLVTIIITTVTFPKSTGQYLAGEVTQRESIDHFFSNLTWRTIKDIELLNEDSVEFSIASAWGSPSFMIFVTLILFLITRFIFTALANTLPVPAGVFFPVFIIGAALGRLVGEVMHVIAQGEIQGQSIVVGGYAVVGECSIGLLSQTQILPFYFEATSTSLPRTNKPCTLILT